MKLGIFGGTFNPVHYGHLINAEILRSDYSLDKIIFVPAKFPVHKKLDDRISAKERCNMVELAINDNRSLELSTIEIDKDSPSYTIITINELLREFSPSELFLIIGSDSFNEIDTWKEYRKILQMVSVIVMKRPGDASCREDLFVNSKNIIIAENPLIDISSTCIRKRIRENKSVKYLVPHNVLSYINNRGLYKN